MQIVSDTRNPYKNGGLYNTISHRFKYVLTGVMSNVVLRVAEGVPAGVIDQDVCVGLSEILVHGGEPIRRNINIKVLGLK
jgi:hypothetical protein